MFYYPDDHFLFVFVPLLSFHALMLLCFSKLNAFSLLMSSDLYSLINVSVIGVTFRL